MKTFNVGFSTYNGGLKAYNGIEAETKEKAIEIANAMAKLSFQPLRFKYCVEYIPPNTDTERK